MDRASIFFLDNENENTYDFDETLPPLPLPELRDTMERYYEILLPFGTPEELVRSRDIIDRFEKGVGRDLHKKLKERAATMKNWLGGWWDFYAYHTLRLPLNPYIVMAMPLKVELLGAPETPEMLLKNLARLTYHTLEFWDLLRKAKIKPLSSGGGKVKYSSALYKHFFSTSRVPGVEVDHIEKHFRIVTEGPTPTHALISGKGRLFMFDCVHADDTLLTASELLVVLQRVRSIIDYEPMGDCVPVLTHDDRTAWANNRQRLAEVSPANRETMKLVESSAIVIVFDENEPTSYEEISRIAVTGDFHSKWGDRSSTFIAYKNGRFACLGEHSAYDGTISVSYAFFIQLGMYEIPEPDWSTVNNTPVVGIKELKFELDNKLRTEIQRVLVDCDHRRTDVVVTHSVFDEFGKDVIKTWKLHPDSFVQVAMQLAYATLHEEVAPIYETALMRHFYNGRTETLRSLTTEVYKFINIATNPNSSKEEIANAFRVAVNHHNYKMDEARKGNGVDRHLFGLWCAAHENNIDIPELYEDPLYARSGGGGNFILSTSTLGYTTNSGFVAPMVLDGYGVFYTITSQAIFIQVSAFRGSFKTSAQKFSEAFKQTIHKIKQILDDVQNSKL